MPTIHRRLAAALSALACLALLPTPARAQSPDAPAPAPGATAPAGEADVKRVVHIPETLRAEIVESIRREVLEQARREGWAAPGAVPAWLSRLKLAGDLRTRLDLAVFPRGNAAGGEFPDFQAINAGAPFDVNFVDVSGERYLNVDQGRQRVRLRARVGLDAAVTSGVAAGLRVATGEGSSPVSTNQTLGASPGLFSRYQVWLDRAFVRLGAEPEAAGGLHFLLGRFENPFLASPLLWSDNVNFDGAAVRGRIGLGGGFSAFAAGGAFPLYTTAFAFPAERTQKFPSRNRWLFAAQAGAAWRPDASVGLTLAAAYYDYYGVEGRPSSPCDTNLRNTTCDTDDTRPAAAQKGNTYRALRTPSDAALVAEAVGQAPRYQYFGLAGSYRELAGTARLEFLPLESLQVTVDGEAVLNEAFSKSRVGAVALNNRAACSTTGCDRFAGGPFGYTARLAVGSPAREVRWSWSASAEYRYLESDAVVDALNDSDFGLGGTNLKGYVLAATLGLAERLTLSARYASADAIVGPRYQVDVVQVDVVARF